MTTLLNGLVLRKTDYSGTDEIVTLLTASEVISFIALGTRRETSKNARALQLGSIVTVEIFRARLTNKVSRLKRAELLLQPPLNLYDTADIVMQILRALQALVTSDARLFAAINDSFTYFGADFNQHIKTFVIFNSLGPRGLAPELKQCLVCGRVDRINDFSFSDGGFLCVLHAREAKPLAYLHAIRALASDFHHYQQVEAALNQQLGRELSAYLQSAGDFSI